VFAESFSGKQITPADDHIQLLFNLSPSQISLYLPFIKHVKAWLRWVWLPILWVFSPLCLDLSYLGNRPLSNNPMFYFFSVFLFKGVVAKVATIFDICRLREIPKIIPVRFQNQFLEGLIIPKKI